MDGCVNKLYLIHTALSKSFLYQTNCNRNIFGESNLFQGIVHPSNIADCWVPVAGRPLIYLTLPDDPLPLRDPGDTCKKM